MNTAKKIQLLPTTTYTTCEHQLTTWDGTTLFYRAWHPGRTCSKAVILFHGGHEHSGRFDELVNQLNINDASIFAWDARGHGRSQGERGYAAHFHDLVRDADQFVRHINTTYDIPQENIIVLGHSVGSVIVSTWLHDYAPPIRGTVLGSPAFHVKLYFPFALPALKVWQKIRPDASVNSYVKPGMLTHDKAEAHARRSDPFISPKIAVRVLTSLFDTSNRVIQGAASIKTPVLLLSAGSDWVVHRKAQQTFFNNLGSQFKRMHVLPGFYHEIFHEEQRNQAIQLAKSFIQRQFNNPFPSNNKIIKSGEAQTKCISQTLPFTSPRKYAFGAYRYFLKTIGRLSHGVQLGWQTGFDSGSTLDYVYRNQAQGVTPLGRIIDRTYLNAIGWQGIRQRGKNLQGTLEQTIRRLLMNNQHVHIMDIASGPGRYLLDTLQRFDYGKVSATCRDWDETGLKEGEQLAKTKDMQNVHYEKADAFSLDSYDGLSTAPNIVIASGLYELFDDNTKIQTSLQGIFNAMPDKGYLIYTNQPHHPQLELIARTLINRDSQPWIMRLRSQAEMNQLVRNAGFTPVTTLIDQHGIFTVNLAVKRV